MSYAPPPRWKSRTFALSKLWPRRPLWRSGWRKCRSGRFAPIDLLIDRVTRTFFCPGLQHKDRLPNIASLLEEKAGYEVIWKGKWHLSYAANAMPRNDGEDWTLLDITAMEKNWGRSEWNPPDAAT